MGKADELNIGKRAFFAAVIILLALMICVGILTYLVPGGSYERREEQGREIIVPDSFTYNDSVGLSPLRWFTAPFEVLVGDDSLVIIVIIIFLLFIGGAVSVLKASNVINSIIGRIISRFGDRKYLLMALIILVFMLFGAVIGIFEEVIPLIPIMITLAYCLKWDAFVGLGMVVLATGFGFAAAISNPFTIGVAQEIAGLPMFSGALFRMGVFVVIYSILFLFLYRYAKKIEKHPEKSPIYKKEYEVDVNQLEEYKKFKDDKNVNRAVLWFVSIIVVLVAVLISGSFLDGISDYSLPIVGVLFLFGGIGAGLFARMGVKKVFKTFGSGALALSPAIVLILMASSIKHIITQGGIMDTILYEASHFIEGTNPYVAVMLIYVLVLVMNFFIGSGSAKAFVVMPIIAPLGDIIGINRQVMVLTFQFGDGFSNVIYPTNPVLLIALGLTVISYPKWFKWTIFLQLFIIVVSILLLELALLTNLGPF